MEYLLWVFYLFLLAVSTVTMLVGELLVSICIFCLLILYVKLIPQVKAMRGDSVEFNNHVKFCAAFSFIISSLGALFPQYGDIILWFWVVIYIFSSIKLDNYFKSKSNHTVKK
jgi:phosphatidylserine synthase